MNIRRTVILFSGILLAASLRAGQIQSLGTDGTTVGDLMAKVGERNTEAAGARQRHSIYIDTTLSAFLFQGAGSLAGANGTFFHTDASVANYRSTAQLLAVGWLAQGVDNSNSLVQYFSVPANTTAFLDDFVTATLGKSGFGSVLVVGVDTFHNIDSSANLDGQSRIWTFQPNSSGKVSLGLPSVDVRDEQGSSSGFALGLRQDGSARTNVGIINLDNVQHTFTVTARGASKTASFTVTVKADSVSQVAIPAGTYGNLFLQIQPTVDGFYWSGYGVSVDNVTGDSWASHVVQP
ncbi:MAG: hypothetical protein ACRD16_16820 [Thermoanaerobaculia bacterium]